MIPNDTSVSLPSRKIPIICNKLRLNMVVFVSIYNLDFKSIIKMMAEVCYFSRFKSIFGFDFWTFINVHFQKKPNTLRKTGFFSATRALCSKSHFAIETVCYDNFFHFWNWVRKLRAPNETKVKQVKQIWFQKNPSLNCAIRISIYRNKMKNKIKYLWRGLQMKQIWNKLGSSENLTFKK